MERKELYIFADRKRKFNWLNGCARAISVVFMPFLIPLLAFCLLLFCTYLRIIPINYRLQVISIVGSFTLVIPVTAIYLFQKINGWGIRTLSRRERRYVPYILTIVSYVTCLIAMYRMHLPRYMTGIIMASLLCMICCTLINFRWKISVHVASGGLMVGGIVSYCMLFNFNPIGWLSFFILLSGMLGTARMILVEHSLWEILLGFMIGLFCGIIGILFI